MKKLTVEKLKDIFPKDDFPQLYSKRGLEKKRVKFVQPKSVTELAYCIDPKGRKILIP